MNITKVNVFLKNQGIWEELFLECEEKYAHKNLHKAVNQYDFAKKVNEEEIGYKTISNEDLGSLCSECEGCEARYQSLSRGSRIICPDCLVEEALQTYGFEEVYIKNGGIVE